MKIISLAELTNNRQFIQTSEDVETEKNLAIMKVTILVNQIYLYYEN